MPQCPASRELPDGSVRYCIREDDGHFVHIDADLFKWLDGGSDDE